MDEHEVATSVDGRVLPPPPTEIARTGPAFHGGKTVRRQRATAGRQIDPLDKLGVGWTVYDRTAKRAWGREDATLDVLKAIRDLDPQVSQAVWNYLRLLNPGHRLVAVVGEGTDEREEEGPAQTYLDQLAARVGAEYGGGLDQLHNVLALSLMTTGAVAAEVAPTGGLNDVEDWYAVDPSQLTFRRDVDTSALVLGQLHADGTFRELPADQVFYQPLDPDVNDPYGRPPFLPAIQAVMSRSVMLSDIRAVAHNAGYPRIDVKVMWEVVKAAAPPQLREPGREADFSAWAEKQLGMIVSDYESLQVDDTFVHYDWVQPALMAASGLSFDFVALDNVLQRQLNSALKTLPILLGLNEGVSETHGSVQWQIQVAGLSALQRVLKRLIEKMGTTSLTLAGFAARARMHYDDTRTVDRLYEAQAELFEAQNLKLDVEMGWRDNDEASVLRTGHDAVAEPGEQSAAQLAADKAAEQAAQVGPAVGTEGQQPTAEEKQQSVDPAWQLLWQELRSVSARAAVPIGEKLDGEMLDRLSQGYADEARRLFQQQLQRLTATLLGEGWDLRSPENRASPRDIADDAFGLAYRREMKKLLRQSIKDGYALAGMPDAKVPEKLVRRIWRDNEPFLDKIRNDLARQIRFWSDEFRAGRPVRMDDVAGWFAQNEYREAMMGQFLTKQGLATGYTNARVEQTGKTVFRWDLGPVKTEHCDECSARAGRTFTSEQLSRMGMPGSINLPCVSNCKCSLTAIRCTKRQMGGPAEARGVNGPPEWENKFDWSGIEALKDRPMYDWTDAEKDTWKRLNKLGEYEEDSEPFEACTVLAVEQKIEAPPPAVRKSGLVKQQRDLTPDELDALVSYQYEYGINDRLRSGRGDVHPADEPQVRLLDGATRSGRTTEAHTFTRYVDVNAFEQLGFEPRDWVGQEYWDEAYLSTSHHRITSPFSNRGVRMEIRAKKGTYGVMVDEQPNRAQFGSESEFLMPRNTVMRITSVTYDDEVRQWVVKATVTGQ